MVLSEPLNAPYARLGAIDAPTDTVNALAFSVDGRLLASAGDDRRVRVYDMDRGFSTFWEHEGSCVFTAVAWRDSVLFVGNMDGEIITFHPTKKWIYRRKSEVLYKTNTPIECLEFDKHGNRLLVCSGADVLLFKNSSRKWHYQDHLPRPGPFGETENYSRPPILATGAYFLGDDDCLLAYLHDGFWKFKFDAWENCRSWGPEEKIAAMAKSPDSTAVVTTNISNGLSWFRSTPENVKKMGTSVDVQPRLQNIPLPVLFINKGQATIMGTTKGYVAIFEAKRGKRIQALKHGEDEIWVTALAYVELAGRRRMIASGEGNCGQRTRIVIWTQDEANGPSKHQKISKFWGVLTRFIKFTTAVGHMVLILMGVIFALSWLFSAQWRERESANFLQYFGRSFIPPPTTPPVVPSATPTGQSPSLTKLKELLISLEDLLVRVGLSIGIQTN
ncbi:WD40-repeat-containing domain protein [Lentinula lateritia]|uniref:WD40-repeat-containing domain protein n=1 Tax=Lentinula lateritia TaxID=40482 RepID=A0ABQ8VQD0_9AGAR|nr:WD40-repeat-containing domain protein [Lentinula lateritia]